ncbi:MAG: PD-(D/E)XK nuclease family protein, partial [Granulosicoccaceae bacterium]
AWKTLVNWPANLLAPEYCLLLPPDKQRDSILQSLDNTRLQREAREEANLLYVALTRAKHMLIISGHAKKRDRPGSWYEQLCQQLGGDELDIATRGYCHRSGEQRYGEADTADATPVTEDTAPALHTLPLQMNNTVAEIAPSRHSAALQADEAVAAACIDEADDSDGRSRGRIIHNLLDTLCTAHAIDETRQLAIASQYRLDVTSPLFVECLEQARRVYEDKAFRHWFDDSRFRYAKNEVPIIYRDPDSGQTVNGIIDRLLLTDDRAIVLDYKTHRHASKENVSLIAEGFRDQLDWYRKGVALLWPDKQVECWLLFTACNEAVKLS